LIDSYVLAPTIFLFNKSSIPEYGLPSMIFSADTSPIPGSLSSSVIGAELILRIEFELKI
jgi:hypothetical protein